MKVLEISHEAAPRCVRPGELARSPPLSRSRQNAHALSAQSVFGAIGSKRLTPGTPRSYFRPPPKVLKDGAPGESLARRVGGPFALLIRRQTRLSRGVKDILVTGITATTLLTSVASASAQNIFEALFGRLGSSPGPVPDANFTARDRQQLANPPYRAGVDSARLSASDRSIPPQGSARHYPGRHRCTLRLLRAPRGQAIRYGAIVGEDAQAWSGVAKSAARKNGQDGRRPRVRSERLGPLPNYVEGGASNPMGARAHLPLLRRQGHALSHPRHQPARMDRTCDFVGLHPVDQ